MQQVLSGHTTPETAYVVTDYPYGFRLRCQIRYWIETKRGHGQRVMSQTTNPKRPGLVWNKPKGSTYSAIKVLFIDDAGHVQNNGLHGYAEADKIAQFVTTYADALTGEYEQNTIKYLQAQARAAARVTWTVTPAGPNDEPRQTIADQVSIMNALTRDELQKG